MRIRAHDTGGRVEDGGLQARVAAIGGAAAPRPWHLLGWSGVTQRDSRGLGTWRTGGCGAKLEREVLLELLSGTSAQVGAPGLLLGLAESDDAAAVGLPGGDILLASLDFAPPVSRDPVIAGAVASVNALNDIWVCGGRPLLALSILGMPAEADVVSFQQLLQASSDVCRRAGAAVAGGHTIRSDEPLFGLAVIGLSDPRRLWTLSGAVPGDALILTKELGAGLLISAARRDHTMEAELRAFAERLTVDHAAAVEALADEPVHAATDISGFGLVGHAANLAEASGVGVRIDAGAVPVYDVARHLADQGHETSITAANMRDDRACFETGSAAIRRILHDPQTAGPLLFATPKTAASGAVDQLRQAGYGSSCIVGEVVERSDPAVVVHAT